MINFRLYRPESQVVQMVRVQRFKGSEFRVQGSKVSKLRAVEFLAIQKND